MGILKSKSNDVADNKSAKSLTVKVKKVIEEAVIPSYAKPGDAGMDLTAVHVEYDAENDNFIYNTGLAMEIPAGYVGLVFPRSSNRKTNHFMTNHVGVIDSGYRGEIMVTFKNRDKQKYHYNQPYNVGDRIAQIIIMPYPTVEFVESDELSETERGEGGHGSTGK